MKFSTGLDDGTII